MNTSGVFAVALARDVPAGTSIGVRVHGVEYVVWRDHSGIARIWEDRCPHRGMKLSLGFVRGDRIACLYHGWEYGAGGRCLKIPAHPDLPVPDTIHVATFQAAERRGMIWLGLAEAPQWPDERPLTPVRSLMIDAPVAQVDAPAGVHVAVQPVTACQTMLHIAVEEADQAETAYLWSLGARNAMETRAR